MRSGWWRSHRREGFGGSSVGAGEAVCADSRAGSVWSADGCSSSSGRSIAAAVASLSIAGSGAGAAGGVAGAESARGSPIARRSCSASNRPPVSSSGKRSSIWKPLNTCEQRPHRTCPCRAFSCCGVTRKRALQWAHVVISTGSRLHSRKQYPARVARLDREANVRRVGADHLAGLLVEDYRERDAPAGARMRHDERREDA